MEVDNKKERNDGMALHSSALRSVHQKKKNMDRR